MLPIPPVQLLKKCEATLLRVGILTVRVSRTLWCSLLLVACLVSAGRAETVVGFQQRLGLQLWSLREQGKTDPLAMLDLAKGYGLPRVETAGTAGLSPEVFAAALRERGLQAVSAHIAYDRFKQDLPGVIAEARALGVQYVIVPTLAQKDGVFDVEAVAADFNRWGETLHAAGLNFGYHPHGFEFVPMADGRTRFDVLMALTKPEFVCYEMDVFWMVHAGMDPVTLLLKHPGRWPLMHLKDIRKGATTGLPTGSAPAADNVAVGQGQIDWLAVVRAAQRAEVRYYFIEDETPAPMQCIPISLGYLRGLKP